MDKTFTFIITIYGLNASLIDALINAEWNDDIYLSLVSDTSNPTEFFRISPVDYTDGGFDVLPFNYDLSYSMNMSRDELVNSEFRFEIDMYPSQLRFYVNNELKCSGSSLITSGSQGLFSPAWINIDGNFNFTYYYDFANRMTLEIAILK